jgi:hypothetical protein
MTMIGRIAPKVSPEIALTRLEMLLLDRLAGDRQSDAGGRPLSAYIQKLAKLGGYLARARDGPPGNMVIWRGLTRLNDMALGAECAVR